MTSPALIFLHIPRTAGTTLHHIIEQQYQPDEVFSMGHDAHRSVREFWSLPQSTRAAFRMVKGHCAYGIHEAIPGPSTYFTLLRDPIERISSEYHYVRRIPTHPLHEAVMESGSLRGYVENEVAYLTDNGQTRMLSGVWHTVPFGACTHDMLEQAKRNLRERFAVVGLTDRFAETLLLLQHTFGWQDLPYVDHNVIAGRPTKKELDAGTLRVLEASSQLDLALYAYGERLFRKQLARQGIAFWARLQMLRLQQRYPAQMAAINGALRKVPLPRPPKR
jgi:hypothetical protein